MKKIFLLHAIIEMIAGIILVFRPDLLLMTSDQILETIIVAKLYGVLALTFGVISFFLFQMFLYNEFFKKIALMIMFFHLMISFQMYAAFNQGTISNLGGFGLHMFMALLFFGAYMKDLNRFAKESIVA